jgi:hypothetical protein
MSAAEQNLNALADAMLQIPGDATEVYEALAQYLDAETFRNLGAKLELCPIHFCDFQICLDDEVHGDEVYVT